MSGLFPRRNGCDQTTHDLVMPGSAFVQLFLLRVRCTQFRNLSRGNADSPSDGYRPSSAQCSISRGNCA